MVLELIPETDIFTEMYEGFSRLTTTTSRMPLKRFWLDLLYLGWLQTK